MVTVKRFLILTLKSKHHWYLSTPVSQAEAAVSKLSECPTDVNDWSAAAGGDSVPQRHRSSGLAPISSWTRLTSELFRSWRLVSQLTSFWTVVWPWPTKLPLSVDPATISYARYALSRGHALSAESANAMVHAFISCLLDYCNSVLTEISDGLLMRLRRICDSLIFMHRRPI